MPVYKTKFIRNSCRLSQVYYQAVANYWRGTINKNNPSKDLPSLLSFSAGPCIPFPFSALTFHFLFRLSHSVSFLVLALAFHSFSCHISSFPALASHAFRFLFRFPSLIQALFFRLSLASFSVFFPQVVLRARTHLSLCTCFLRSQTHSSLFEFVLLTRTLSEPLYMPD